LYTNIDQKLWNRLHGPMHYKIVVTCVQWTQDIFSIITRQSIPSNSKSSSLV